MLPTVVNELARRELAGLRKESLEGPKLNLVDVMDGKSEGVFSVDGIWSWIAEKLVKTAG